MYNKQLTTTLPVIIKPVNNSKRIRAYSKPGKIRVGIMIMQKRSQTCSLTSQSGYRPPMVVDGVKMW